MFARAVIAFLALPGVVAFIVPIAWLWYAGRTQVAHPVGLVILAAGVAALLWCVRDFYVVGKGTLAPWAPPQHMVIVGLYRHTRNPMYVAVVLILLGWALAFDLPALYLYAAAVAIAFHLRVVLGEEPWLARRHGRSWDEYISRVPRWFW